MVAASWHEVVEVVKRKHHVRPKVAVLKEEKIVLVDRRQHTHRLLTTKGGAHLTANTAESRRRTRRTLAWRLSLFEMCVEGRFDRREPLAYA